MIKKLILLTIFNFVLTVNAQKIVFQGFKTYGLDYLENSIIDNLSKSGLNIEKRFNEELVQDEIDYKNNVYSVSKIDKKLNNNSSYLKELGYSFILLPIKTKNVLAICCTYDYNNNNKQLLSNSNEIWWGEYLLYNLNNKKSKTVRLTISTSGKYLRTLESSSNIISFSQEVNDFVQLINAAENTLTANKINSNYSDKTNSKYSSNTFISKPSLMVIPNKINPAKLINGEYQLSKYEKMLIAAFKNKFEDNHFTTFGFESVLKRIYENRVINDNVYDDIKSKILEGSGIDFFVEFENLDENNTNCDKVYDFKIRNFSTGEDVASDLKNLNQCGNSDVYKDFASSILNEGAVSKINNQFNSILKNGQKVNIVFTVSNTSQARFNKQFNGIKLGVHINNCLQSLSLNGNLELQEETDLRKQAIVNIPVLDANSGQRYQSTTCAEAIISYLNKNAGIECDRVVSRQSINIKIK